VVVVASIDSVNRDELKAEGFDAVEHSEEGRFVRKFEDEPGGRRGHFRGNEFRQEWLAERGLDHHLVVGTCTGFHDAQDVPWWASTPYPDRVDGGCQAGFA
jgi:hypothetical protein